MSDPQQQHELERLREALEAAQKELATARGGHGDPGALEELRNQLLALQEESEGRDQAFDQLTRDNLCLQSELEMAAKGRDNAAREAQELR